MRPGDLLSQLLASTPDDEMRIVPRLISSDLNCPLRAAVLAPLMVQDRRAGTPITFYRTEGRPSQDELRVVAEAASLVSAQVELSVLPEQEERLAAAELRALRGQISPHFIYNALAAVAGNIHLHPEEAREQLIDFAVGRGGAGGRAAGARHDGRPGPGAGTADVLPGAPELDIKCPRQIDFRRDMPREPTGKLLKRKLHDEYRAAPAPGREASP